MTAYSTPNEAFAFIRPIIPEGHDAVVIYGRTSSHWTHDKQRASETSFAFHRSVSIAEAAANEAMKYQHCDWCVVFERQISTFWYGRPETAWVVRIAYGVE